MGFKLSLRDDTPEQVEFGGSVLPDWYLVRLIDSYEDADKDGVTVLKFATVLGGRTGTKYAEKFIYERLYDPSFAKKRENAEKKIKLWAHRMGLIQANDFGVETDKEIEFMDAIGWEGFVEITSQQWTNDDGTVGSKVGPTYSGIYPKMYEDTRAADKKSHKKYPKDFPEEWRKANTVAGAVGSVGTGNAALDDMAAAAAAQAAAGRTPTVAAIEDQLRSRFAGL